MNDSKIIRTRVAPSPTGELHVGSMAILLKNYAYAKRHGGKFVLRIEDTDKTREVEGGVEDIQNIIHAYGLDWDEGPGKEGGFGPYIQSQRFDIYQEKAHQLVEDGKAYYCFCSKERLDQVRAEQQARKEAPRYDKHCRNIPLAEAKARVEAGESYVIRLKVPENQDISFTDLLRGEITFNSNQVDEQVLLKSDGYPTYHLAVVIDDHLMKITHIMRGEEWISSTPKHVLLYQAFGWDLPTFAHIPLFLNPDGKGKMSKRKGTVSARSFLEKGYLPEALLNFFMILGWARDDQEKDEIMSLEEYISEFDPKDMSLNSVAFDMRKLDWINGVYIRRLDLATLKEKIKPFLSNQISETKLDQLLPLVRERLVTLNDFDELTSFFFEIDSYDPQLLLKKSANNPELVKIELDETISTLESLADFSVNSIEEAIRELQEKHDWKKGQYFMMIRIAITGRKATPPLFETIEVLGKEETIDRLQKAKNLLN